MSKSVIKIKVLCALIPFLAISACMGNDPVKDGKKAAEIIYSNDLSSNKNNIRVLSDFLCNFDKYGFIRGSDAKARFDSLNSVLVKNNDQDRNKVEKDVIKLKNKYMGYKEKTENFDYAFQQQMNMFLNEGANRSLTDSLNVLSTKIQKRIKVHENDYLVSGLNINSAVVEEIAHYTGRGTIHNSTIIEDKIGRGDKLLRITVSYTGGKPGETKFVFKLLDKGHVWKTSEFILKYKDGYVWNEWRHLFYSGSYCDVIVQVGEKVIASKKFYVY